MSIVKMNYEEFADIELNVQKAYESLEAAENCWGTNFDNLYNNIVASGYLDSLYEDAESNWRKWKGTITVVASVATIAGTGAKIAAVVVGGALMGPVGWVLAAIAVLGAIFGIGVGIKQIAKEPDWMTVSKDVFAQLLYNCMIGADDNYIRIANLATKFYNVKVNLEKIKQKVNDFNVDGANFQDAADKYSLSVRTGGADGQTITGIETEVVIDGQTVKMDTSEAMSAFYTYAYTVTSSMIAADYLERTYGYEIDYLGLVTKANAFMADTIQSDLYTSEMIHMLLPQYVADEDAAIAAASASTGLTDEELKAAIEGLRPIGTGALFAGILGTSVMGPQKDKDGNCTKCGNNPCTCGSQTGTKCSKCGNDPCTCTCPKCNKPLAQCTCGGSSTGNKCSKCGNSPCTCTCSKCGKPLAQCTCGGGTSGTNNCPTCGKPYSQCTCGGSSGGGPTGGTTKCSVCGQDPCVCVSNNYPITDPVEGLPDDKLPIDLGVTNTDGTVDYDKLAMEEYQFETGKDAIEEFRLNIMNDVEAKYAAGDFTALTEKLQGYGYGTAEIATILASKSMTIKACMDGETRAILAQKAAAMAKADGVDNYSSKYSTKPSTDELGDNKKPLKSLHLNSDNKELCDMEDKLDGLETDYKTKVDEANKLIDEATVDRKAVDAIKEKYEKQYGTDTSKWSEDAAKEYDAAIDKYNESATKANDAIKAADESKKAYQTSRAEFDKACEDYYKSKIISEEEENQNNTVTESGTVTDNTVTDSGTVTEPSNGGAVANPDGSITIGGSSTSGDTGSTGDSGIVTNPDGSITIGGSGSTTDSVADTSSSTGAVSVAGTSDNQDAFLASLGLKSNNKDNN